MDSDETYSSVIFTKDREGDANLRHKFCLVNRKTVIILLMTKVLQDYFSDILIRSFATACFGYRGFTIIVILPHE
jgi:hypothetical protein